MKLSEALDTNGNVVRINCRIVATSQNTVYRLETEGLTKGKTCLCYL